MYTRHTLVVVPILNNQTTNRLFIENAKKFYESIPDAHIVFVFKDVSYQTIRSFKDMFGIPHKFKVESHLKFYGKIGVLAPRNVLVSMGCFVNEVCSEIGHIFDNVIIKEPDVFLLPAIYDIFNTAGKRAGWSSLVFASSKIESPHSFDYEEAGLRLDLLQRDLGYRILENMMIFPDKTYDKSDYRVIICKGHIFRYTELNVHLDKGFVLDLSDDIANHDEGVALYGHTMNTYHIGD